MRHEFKTQSGQLLPKSHCSLYTTDVCIFCNQSVDKILNKHNYKTGIYLTLQYLRESKYILECLTE